MDEKLLLFEYFNHFFPHISIMILYNETIVRFHAGVNVSVWKCAGNWCFESYINSTVRNQNFMSFLLVPLTARLYIISTSFLRYCIP